MSSTLTRAPAASLRGPVLPGLLALLLLAVVASLALGARDVSLAQVWAALVDPVAGDNDHLVVRDLRVPRTLVGLVGGAALGVAGALMEDLRARLAELPGTKAGALTVAAADDFAYTDPISGEAATKQGIRILFAEDARLVLRLSGTGTEGATLRVYMERRLADPAEAAHADPQVALAQVIEAAESLAGIRARTGREGPDVAT